LTQALPVGYTPFNPEVHDPQVYWQQYQRTLINAWSRACIGQIIPITACKDFHMYLLYDDRCVQVVPNTGQTLAESMLASFLAGARGDDLH
jgi:hypothetical protein